MEESPLIGQKTLWEKEKLLVKSNFSFSRSVFKRLVLHTRKNQGLFGKGLSNMFNFLPNDNILDCFKLKAFTDNKINDTEVFKFALGRVENIVGKGEMLITSSSLLLAMFSKASFCMTIKTF